MHFAASAVFPRRYLKIDRRGPTLSNPFGCLILAPPTLGPQSHPHCTLLLMHRRPPLCGQFKAQHGETPINLCLSSSCAIDSPSTSHHGLSPQWRSLCRHACCPSCVSSVDEEGIHQPAQVRPWTSHDDPHAKGGSRAPSVLAASHTKPRDA